MFLLIFYRENFLKFFTQNLVDDVFSRKFIFKCFFISPFKIFFLRKLFEHVLYGEETWGYEGGGV